MNHFLHQFDQWDKQLRKLHRETVQFLCHCLQPYCCHLPTQFPYRKSLTSAAIQPHLPHHLSQCAAEFKRLLSEHTSLNERLYNLCAHSQILQSIVPSSELKEIEKLQPRSPDFTTLYRAIENCANLKEESAVTLANCTQSGLKVCEKVIAIYQTLWKQKEAQFSQVFLSQFQFLNAWERLFVQQWLQQGIASNKHVAEEYQSLTQHTLHKLVQHRQSMLDKQSVFYQQHEHEWSQKKPAMKALLQSLVQFLDQSNPSSITGASIITELQTLITRIDTISCQHLLLANSTQQLYSQPNLPCIVNDIVQFSKDLHNVLQKIVAYQQTHLAQQRSQQHLQSINQVFHENGATDRDASQHSQTFSPSTDTTDKDYHHRDDARPPAAQSSLLDMFSLCKDTHIYRTQQLQDKHNQLLSFYNACVKQVAEKERFKELWYQRLATKEKSVAKGDDSNNNNNSSKQSYSGHTVYTLDYMLQLQPEIVLLKANTEKLSQKLQEKVMPDLLQHQSTLKLFEVGEQCLHEIEQVVAFFLNAVTLEITMIGEQHQLEQSAYQQSLLQQNLCDQTLSLNAQRLEELQLHLVEFLFYSVDKAYQLMLDQLEQTWRECEPNLESRFKLVEQIHDDIATTRGRSLKLPQQMANELLKARALLVSYVTQMELYQNKLLAFLLQQRGMQQLRMIEMLLSQANPDNNNEQACPLLPLLNLLDQQCAHAVQSRNKLLR